MKGVGERAGSHGLEDGWEAAANPNSGFVVGLWASHATNNRKATELRQLANRKSKH